MVVLDVPADRAPQHLFLSVFAVPATHRTNSFASAFGQLLLGVLADVVALALALVAGLAEVRVAPAEPLRDAAAELALEFYEVLAVLGAVLDRDVAAVGADQLLRLEGASHVVGLVHGCDAVLPASEVGILALEALEVGVDDAGVLLWLAEVRRVLVLQFLVRLLQLLKFQSLYRHRLDLLPQQPELFGGLVEFAVGIDCDPGLAERTVAEVEEDTRSQPLYLEPLLEALDVEDVAA